MLTYADVRRSRDRKRLAEKKTLEKAERKKLSVVEADDPSRLKKKRGRISAALSRAHHTIYVSSSYMCPHSTQSYYICVLVLHVSSYIILYMCPRPTCVLIHHTICVLVLNVSSYIILHMCPRPTCVLIVLSHTIYVSSSYMCPHSTQSSD
jgi:hypothetical protein